MANRILVLIILFILKWRRKQEMPYLLCFLIFGVYILEIVKLTFFPLAITGGFAETSRLDPEWSTYINLIPFSVGKGGYDGLSILQFAQNIPLMLPFGFGVNFVARVRRKDYIWISRETSSHQRGIFAYIQEITTRSSTL